jgi:hypothetical protein
VPWSESYPRCGGASSNVTCGADDEGRECLAKRDDGLVNACLSKYLVLRGTLLLLEEEES